MSFFAHKSNAQQPTVLYGYPAQTSLYGVPIKIAYGQNRISGDVIWTGDWQANQVNTGGKGGSGKGASGKGGGGNAQYTYASAIAIALCQGVVGGILTIYVDKARLTIASVQETVTVPLSGGTYRTVTVSQAPTFNDDAGAAYGSPYSVVANDYGSPGPQTLTGTQYVPLVQVGSNPGAGQYSVDPLTGIYTFNSADAGKTVVIGYTFHQVTTSDSGQPVADLNLSLFTGATAQAPWGYLTTNHPSQALGYSGVAYVGNSLMDLGSSGLVSNYGFEIQGLLPFGGGIVDAEPSAVIQDFLTNSVYGAGFLTTEIGDLTEIRTYCVANGLFISPVVDTQQAARDWIQEWLTVGNSEAVWSDGVLKFRCRGDKTAVGNGVTYTPNTQPIYNLDDDAFLAGAGQDPVKVNRPSVRDADNVFRVEWANRYNAYQYEPLEEKDDLSIQLFGVRPVQSPLTLHSVTLQPVAQAVAVTELRKSVYVRNQVSFKLPAWAGLLEPMDMVTVTDLYLGYDTYPVRLLTIEEDDHGELSCTAEEFPWSAATPALYPKQTASSFGPGYFAPPGSVNPPMFVELPTDVTQGNPYVLGIALSGGQNWGGALVFVSTDGGASYTQVGRQTGVATMGALTAPLPAANDPDDSNTLAVNLTESYGLLDSFSAAQENAFVPLVAVEGEILAYRTATLSSQFNYNVTHLRRGVYGTGIATHATGAQFCVVDSLLFQWQFDASVVNTTVYFKFCSFNESGQRPEDIANVTAYSFFVANPRHPLPWAPGFDLPTSNDPIWTAEKFGLLPGTAIDKTGQPIITLGVYGNPPINKFSPTATAPVINSVTVASGGSIAGGATYVVGISANDAVSNALVTALSNLVIVTIPAGSGYKLTLNVTWGAASYGASVYVAAVDASHPFYFEGTIGTGGSTSGTHSYDLTSIVQTYVGPPDGNFDHFLFRLRHVAHSGCWAEQVTGLAVNALQFSSASFTTNEWAGYRVSLLAFVDPTKTPIIWDATVLSNTATQLNLDRSVAPISVGDLIVMRLIPSSISATQFSATKFVNTFEPSGLSAHAESGNEAWIIDGTGWGQRRLIADNAAGAGPITLAEPWAVLPDSTSVIIIVEAGLPTDLPQPSITLQTYAGFTGLCGTIPVQNYVDLVVLIQALTVAADGSFDETYAPLRELFLFGVPPGLRIITANSTMLPGDVTILIDTTSAAVDYQLLPTAAYQGRVVNVIWKAGGNTARIVAAAGETVFGASSFTFSAVGDPKQLVANG